MPSVAGIAIDTPSRLILWDLARATGGVIGSAAIAAAVSQTFRLLSPSATAANALSICIGAVALSVLFSALSHSTRRT